MFFCELAFYSLCLRPKHVRKSLNFSSCYFLNLSFPAAWRSESVIVFTQIQRTEGWSWQEKRQTTKILKTEYVDKQDW